MDAQRLGHALCLPCCSHLPRACVNSLFAGFDARDFPAGHAATRFQHLRAVRTTPERHGTTAGSPGTRRFRAIAHSLGRMSGALDMGGQDPDRREFSVTTASLARGFNLDPRGGLPALVVLVLDLDLAALAEVREAAGYVRLPVLAAVQPDPGPLG